MLKKNYGYLDWWNPKYKNLTKKTLKMVLTIEQKGTTLAIFPLFSSLLKKDGKNKKKNEKQKSWFWVMPFCSIVFTASIKQVVAGGKNWNM